MANGNEFQEQVRQLGKLVTQFDQMPDSPQRCGQRTRAAPDGRARRGPRKDDGDRLREPAPPAAAIIDKLGKDPSSAACCCSTPCIPTTWRRA